MGQAGGLNVKLLLKKQLARKCTVYTNSWRFLNDNLHTQALYFIQYNFNKWNISIYILKPSAVLFLLLWIPVKQQTGEILRHKKIINTKLRWPREFRNWLTHTKPILALWLMASRLYTTDGAILRLFELISKPTLCYTGLQPTV